MRVLLIRLLTLVMSASAVLIIVTFVLSPQQTADFVGGDGGKLINSIAEIRTIKLNGVEQRVLIRGRDVSNPVLLHLHGGPGGADQAIIRSSGRTIEDLFTVVYWDQRGAGASYDAALTAQQLTLAHIVKDGVALSEQLKKEFGKDKIYLHAHSWGTLVGIHMITERPNLYHAYIGIGQMARSKQAELLSYQYTKRKAEQAGDVLTVARLNAIGSPPYASDQAWLDNVLIERDLMQAYEIPGEAPRFTMWGVYQDFIGYSGYSVIDKLKSLQGSKVSYQALWMEAINADLLTSHPKLEVPIYILQGKYDQHTVTSVAKEYYDGLTAPHKEYINFEQSAHWPHIEEYEKYRHTLRQIINSQ